MPLVYAVGDCFAPGTIANATAKANIVARRVETMALEQRGILKVVMQDKTQ